ncbi:YgaP family membrane protein [Psychroserpens mesophilus]|uniref:YgaP family membrane protein n=1 Tax=Psychroserpens mesophilus TaxID=325473 RepID=UPI0009FDF489|nr:DUF2892 domain-containing protein [Psychroserpens mesophilus]
MKANMGNTDRLIRIVIAVIIGILYWQGLIEGTLAYILIALSVIFVLTSLINFCPLYTLFGINTCKRK